MATPDKMPKAVADVREELKQKGLDLASLSADQLYAAVPAGKLNILRTGAKRSQGAQVQTEFKNMDASARREWLVSYVLDPSGATCSGFDRSTAVNNSLNEEGLSWITEEQMGGPLYLNSPAAASIVVKSGVLPKRAHEIGPLADAGWEQHEFSWSKVTRARC